MSCDIYYKQKTSPATDIILPDRRGFASSLLCADKSSKPRLLDVVRKVVELGEFLRS